VDRSIGNAAGCEETHEIGAHTVGIGLGARAVGRDHGIDAAAGGVEQYRFRRRQRRKIT
jgi:hypothetical protein